MAKYTPMMEQYLEIKKQNQDCILFYRLGDFYEMFFEDAIIASKELEITLTGKNCGQDERAPMCGVPYHACDTYLNQLIEKGYKVGICEQVEDPKSAKGIVKREVVRIVTPGTNISTQNLDETKNNYLMCIYCGDGEYGISFVDITTGDFRTTTIDDAGKLMDEIFKFTPAEIICNDAFFISGIDLKFLKDRLHISISTVDHYYFDEENGIRMIKKQFHIDQLDGLGITDFPLCVVATGALLCYLNETQKHSLEHLTKIIPYITSDYMLIDSASRRNLELCETMREKQKKGSLLWVLDKTKTAMGARLLRLYIEKEGFTVVIANDGRKALELFDAENPDLIMLDIMLPELDGWQVCREIRKKSQCPIIMLTAKGEVFDKVLGLELGADDYVVKPFEAKEVVARIKAVLRRAGKTNTDTVKEVKYDKLSINLTNYELKVNGVQVDTPPKEMELIYHLASNPNRVFTRDQLLDEVWGFDYYGDSRTVDVHVKRLREKLEGVSDKWSLKTVWGVGYKFEVKE